MFGIVRVLRIAPSNLGSVLANLESSRVGTARFWLGISLVAGGFYEDALPLLKSGREAGVEALEAAIGKFALARAYEELGQVQEEREELVERLVEGFPCTVPKTLMDSTWPADWRLWIEAAKEAETRRYGVLDPANSAVFVRRFFNNDEAREAYATMCESFNQNTSADLVRDYQDLTLSWPGNGIWVVGLRMPLCWALTHGPHLVCRRNRSATDEQLIMQVGPTPC
jgi:hypothetical protein